MAFAETQFGKFFYFGYDSIGSTIARNCFWEGHLRPYFDVLGPESVLVDVGANIGFFSVYSALARKAKVHAFEASSTVFELLKRNIDINELSDQVITHPVALYDKIVNLDLNTKWVLATGGADELAFYENSPNSGGLSLFPKVDGTWRAVPLDYFNLKRVDLLKVDTQGSDLRVLVGGEKTILRCRPVILFEYEEDGSGKNASGDSLADFVAFFMALQYRIKHLGNVDYVAEPEAL